jgi:hypothetical protein
MAEGPRAGQRPGIDDLARTMKVSVRRIVFANARGRVHRAEWALARDHDVAVRRDVEIEGAQFGIRDQPRGLRGRAWSKGHDGVFALAVRADS